MKNFNRVKLDGNGILIVLGKELALANIRKRAPRLQPIQNSSDITADFIREIKTELIQELAQIFRSGPVRGARYERDDSAEPRANSILIDDSVFVTDLSIGYVEKGFDEITEAQVSEDKQVGSSISKLRSMKRGN